VRQFGATCNGEDDDTGAFERAVDATAAGGVLFIPSGECVLTATIVLSRPIEIIGEGFGSQIYGRGDYTLLQLKNVTNSTIRDLYLGSQSTQAGVALIELVNSHRNVVSNVTMLGGFYGLHLKGSLLNTVTDLRSGVNFGGFFAVTSKTNTWVMAEAYNQISANANTFIAPILEGGANGMLLTDSEGQGSWQVLGGTIEGVSGVGLSLQGTFLPSSITGVHFEANGSADIVIRASNNIRISSIVSSMPINLLGDTRNVTISDSAAQTIYIDMGDNNYPGGTGAKRIQLQNITACWAALKLDITPAPALDWHFNMPNGPSSPSIINPASGQPRQDIIYNNIGSYCGGG